MSRLRAYSILPHGSVHFQRSLSFDEPLLVFCLTNLVRSGMRLLIYAVSSRIDGGPLFQVIALVSTISGSIPQDLQSLWRLRLSYVIRTDDVDTQDRAHSGLGLPDWRSTSLIQMRVIPAPATWLSLRACSDNLSLVLEHYPVFPITTCVQCYPHPLATSL